MGLQIRASWTPGSPWSVSGIVESVARASELGGRVVAPPYDIPGTSTRQAVLADRQGASFSVTKVSTPS